MLWANANAPSLRNCAKIIVSQSAGWNLRIQSIRAERLSAEGSHLADAYDAKRSSTRT